MSAPPPDPPADDKDWTWVLDRPCPDCGFDAESVRGVDVPVIVREVLTSFLARLTDADAQARPSPTIWSPIEYACHVRDVCTIFARRAHLMLSEDDPLFDNWDQDQTAQESRYWAQSSSEVAAELPSAFDKAAEVFAAVPTDSWGRTGRRSNGSVFTVETLARYFAHDLVHHRHDIAWSR